MKTRSNSITRRPMRAAFATLVVAVAAAAASTAIAQSGTAAAGGGSAAAATDASGHPPHGHGWHHGRDHHRAHGHRHGRGDDFALGFGGFGGFGTAHLGPRALDLVQATPEQRAEIRRIFGAARDDLRAQRDATRALHDQARALFAQPTVDANAAEALRRQLLAQHDQASQRALRAMLDASVVLTPEQRRVLAERSAERRQRIEQRRAARGAPGASAPR